MERSGLITDRVEIERVVAAARAAGSIGLDTEFMRERSYRARLCLVQVAAGADIALIDPPGGADLAPVVELLADPDIEIVVHAGKQDLDIFYDSFDVVPRNVFDVQLAAGFAGLGASLPYGRLVEVVAGVSLGKGESYTDWCRRPLTAEQFAYAADDVRYLVGVARRLERDLEKLGRSAWVRDEMSSLEDAGAYGIDPGDAWRKVSGRGALSGRQAAVLKELAAWRERAAARRDLPRGWLIKDPTLIEIARRQPRSVADLKSIRGLNGREADRSGAAILSAVQTGRGAEAPDKDERTVPKPVQTRSRMMAGLADALVRSRCQRARVAGELVVTRTELESLFVDVFCKTLDPQRHRVLGGWRREVVGDALLSLARGEIAIRAVDDPPYVEEVRL